MDSLAELFWSLIGLLFAFIGIQACAKRSVRIQNPKGYKAHHYTGWRAVLTGVVCILFGILGLPLLFGMPTLWSPYLLVAWYSLIS